MYARYIPPTKNTKPAQKPAVPERGPEPTASVSAPPILSATPYARYIPPAAGKKTEQAAAPRRIVFTEDDFPEPNTQKKRKRRSEEADEPEPSLQKSPKKSRAVAKVIDGSDQDSGQTRGGREATKVGDEGDGKAPKGTKRKKEKKSTKRHRDHHSDDAGVDEDSRDGSVAAGGPATVAALDNPEAGSDASEADKENRKSKKERKEKKEKKERKESRKEDKAEKRDKKRRSKEKAPEVDLDESPDGRQKKHKAILERKEKSLSRLAAEAPSGPQRSTPATHPEAADGQGQEEEEDEEAAKEIEEVHGLEPLPQPEVVDTDHGNPSYETLPPWLAAPIRVGADARAPFTSLGISPEASKILASKGYKEAFAVQTAAIPLLLPSPDRQGDVVISAATGSGKTLAYVLPMIRDLSQGAVTRLRGLIVVPTRELVKQAQEACEACAGAFAGAGRKRVRIGISMGSQSLRQEQAALMEEEQVFDPEGYARWKLGNKTPDLLDGEDGEETRQSLAASAPLDTSTPLPDHVIRHTPKVDVLICTPGRLVEHVSQTPGFDLDYVRWLVVDEADKLLAQSFQQWLDVVTDKLSVQRSSGARDFASSNKSGVRKVVLSATMTRDLSLLGSLRLRRPKLVVLEGQRPDEQSLGVEGEHVLPDLLRESAIKVRNPNLKPLYLVDLLNSKHMTPADDGGGAKGSSSGQGPAATAQSPSETSDSESESDSDLDSDDSASSSSSSSSSLTKSDLPPLLHNAATVLIFLKSNESALRLSRLLAILSPRLAPLIGTLVSTARTAERRRTLRAFAAGRVRILVASDLVARGIDLPRLDHVVNYDVPAGAAPYVHRVGRTARAGRAGHAWSLVTNPEARWFWREIGGEGRGEGGSVGATIRRAAKVERIRVSGVGGGVQEEQDGGRFSEERVKAYEDALEQLGREAEGMRRKR